MKGAAAVGCEASNWYERIKAWRGVVGFKGKGKLFVLYAYGEAWIGAQHRAGIPRTQAAGGSSATIGRGAWACVWRHLLKTEREEGRLGRGPGEEDREKEDEGGKNTKRRQETGTGQGRSGKRQAARGKGKAARRAERRTRRREEGEASSRQAAGLHRVLCVHVGYGLWQGRDLWGPRQGWQTLDLAGNRGGSSSRRLRKIAGSPPTTHGRHRSLYRASRGAEKSRPARHAFGRMPASTPGGSRLGAGCGAAPGAGD